jgi:tetratricopeptide (TPR) repeat protein
MINWLRRLIASDKSDPTKIVVEASRGGIAAGRDIRHSTINVGLDDEAVGDRITQAQQPIVDQLRILVDQIARDKGIPAAPLRTVLAKLGEIDVPDAEIPKRLEAAASQLIELRAKIGRSRVERPEFAVLRQHVLELLDKGDLDGARTLLQRGQEHARALQLIREQVELIATEGLVDYLQIRYRDAAAKYMEAAALVSKIDADGVWGLLMHQGDALSAQGTEFADGQALADAIVIYKRCLTLAPRPLRPLDWATTQNALGVVFSRLGEREGTTERLRDAISAYTEALKERTRERDVLEWALSKNNLGNALTELGSREDNVAMLESAVAAYDEALQECTREGAPLEWANIQSNLGTTLQLIGEHEVGTNHLERSVECYQAALKERTRARCPLDWAMTQNNLGNTLRILSEREHSIDRLKRSIQCFLNALEERTVERVPLDWAMSTSNLGSALVLFGAVEGNPHRIRAGIDAFRAALAVFEGADAGRYVEGTRRNITNAELVLASIAARTAESN